MSLLSNTRTVLWRQKKEESGQSLVLVVLVMTVIMGCAAIAIDIGRLHNEQIKVQNATDFAALAAVNGLPTYGSACDYAKKYAGLKCDGNPRDLTVTESIMLCEKGKLWPFVAGETAGSSSGGAVLIE